MRGHKPAVNGLHSNILHALLCLVHLSHTYTHRSQVYAETKLGKRDEVAGLQCSAVSGSEVSRNLCVCWPCAVATNQNLLVLAATQDECPSVCAPVIGRVCLCPESSCMAEMMRRLQRKADGCNACKLADRTRAIILLQDDNARCPGKQVVHIHIGCRRKRGNSPHQSYPTPAARDPPWGAHRS